MRVAGPGRWLACLDVPNFYPLVIKQRQGAKNTQQSTCASQAKNTRQFLWDDNSSRLRPADFPAQSTYRELQAVTANGRQRCQRACYLKKIGGKLQV